MSGNGEAPAHLWFISDNEPLRELWTELAAEFDIPVTALDVDQADDWRQRRGPDGMVMTAWEATHTAGRLCADLKHVARCMLLLDVPLADVPDAVQDRPGLEVVPMLADFDQLGRALHWLAGDTLNIETAPGMPAAAEA